MMAAVIKFDACSIQVTRDRNHSIDVAPLVRYSIPTAPRKGGTCF